MISVLSAGQYSGVGVGTRELVVWVGGPPAVVDIIKLDDVGVGVGVGTNTTREVVV